MPVRLEDLTPASIVAGLVPNIDATVVQSSWHGSKALTLTYRTPDGSVSERVLFRDDESTLSLVESSRAWAFDADGALFRVAAEGLVMQWQDELYEKFGLRFDLLTKELADSTYGGNPFVNNHRLIADRFAGRFRDWRTGTTLISMPLTLACSTPEKQQQRLSALSGLDFDSLPTELRDFLQAKGITELPTAPRVVLVGTAMAPGASSDKGDGVVVNTMWGRWRGRSAAPMPSLL